ncbi:hypothetical protein BDW59DRAFT_1756 [Aspergillus cavernicola]|uniref:CBF1-interacting co-repressor CIR N-terminal domain-containing protein n=1 Tax=Aspergillus cavernicola TaxID=176166 RepID=A0ABR4J4S3_9EURO
MPLHLLGKKSWNVYNTENIARVQRDEAQAKAQEEEEERRMQEADAERRIQILRGERPSTPPPPPPSQSSTSRPERKDHTGYPGGQRKRRHLAGENDTDRDIRVAHEDAELALAKRDELVSTRKTKNNMPLHDSDGYINLFPAEDMHKRAEKNPEAEKEAVTKQRSYEDQYTMRFSNAAGFRQDIGKVPWYSSSQGNGVAPEPIPGKNVWGNDDPMRNEREKARMNLNDPLLAMRKGIRQLKSVEEERKKWNQERSRELDALRLSEKTRSPRRRRRSQSKDSLEGFTLDESTDRSRDRDRSSHRHHQHSRHKESSHSHRRPSSTRSRSYSHRQRRNDHHHRNGRDSRESQADSRHRNR